LKICNSKACSGKQIPNHITTLMDSKDNLMWASNSDVSDLRELMIQGIFGLEFRDDSIEYITKKYLFGRQCSFFFDVILKRYQISCLPLAATIMYLE